MEKFSKTDHRSVRRHSRSTEHYLVPLGLVVLNVCLIHFLFALSSGTVYSILYKSTIGCLLLALAISIFYKRRRSIIIVALLYLFILSGIPAVWLS